MIYIVHCPTSLINIEVLISVSWVVLEITLKRVKMNLGTYSPWTLPGALFIAFTTYLQPNFGENLTRFAEGAIENSINRMRQMLASTIAALNGKVFIIHSVLSFAFFKSWFPSILCREVPIKTKVHLIFPIFDHLCSKDAYLISGKICREMTHGDPLLLVPVCVRWRQLSTSDNERRVAQDHGSVEFRH